jgi:hypothetical protein
VSLNDWLCRDGRIILSQRVLKDVIGKMKATLVEAGYSPSILETEAPQSIFNALFPAGRGPAQKLRIRFQDLCTKYELAQVGIAESPPESTCAQVAKIAPKLRDSMLVELVNQRLAGNYFLGQLEPDGEDAGYVVLLREIQILPRPVAHAISNGLDSACFAEMCAADPRLTGRLRVGPDDLAMALSVIRSPNIEHLMQAFCLLFGRIGIADPDPNYVDSLWARQTGVVEAE